MKSVYLRLCLAIIIIFMGFVYALPNIPSIGNSFLNSVLPTSRINLGLDLKGGMSLTLGVDLEKSLSSTLTSVGQAIREQMSDEGYMILRPRLNEENQLSIVVPSNTNATEVKELISSLYPNLSLINEEIMTDNKGITFIYTLSETAKLELEDFTLEQVVRTIRNRIDQFGVAEPDIRRQSGNQIQVQLPGLSDPQRAIQVIGQTAHLEFHIVRDDVDATALVLPIGTAHYPYVEENSASSSIVLDTESLMTGSDISDARPTFDENGSPQVSISFNPRGSVTFERITGENVQKRMAIVLDGKVYSAPVIQQQISGGQAVINGNFTIDEANDLAIILRAGSLPAPVNVLEERTVGPSLGQESIDSGIFAAIIGALAVLVAMPLFYATAGLVANVLLCATMVLLFAGLTAFGATLTLPGIAGIVLTIGMAVDANVLIFERIREEIKLGLKFSEAVKAGFNRATISIVDSNLTTIIAALILYQFGTGPVKGFAITLTLGIIASMFTSIFVCRAIFELYVQRSNGKTMNI